ncbi:MAG: B-box zinc finger protein [Nitriliruptorales bacterium]|nr:B-box zinc finger protein [Nitriliruptorales bacterium]
MTAAESADRELETTCQRHPRTATRLHCSECGTPICPRCSVETVVGQKCPSCARPAKAARRQGKPDQYVKAVAFGTGAAVGLGLLLYAFFTGVGYLVLITSGAAGYGVGRAVHAGAGGNRSAPFRRIAMVLSVLMVAGVWLLGFGTLAPASLGALSYLAAPYGAFLVHR